MGVVLAVVSQGLRPGVGTAQPLVSWAWALLRAGFPGWGQAERGPGQGGCTINPFTGSHTQHPFWFPGSVGAVQTTRLRGRSFRAGLLRAVTHTRAVPMDGRGVQRGTSYVSMLLDFSTTFLSSDAYLPKKQKDHRAFRQIMLS